LFGARQGSHSTATRDMEGKVQAAEGGTLFLDEVGDLPLGVQVKLLQFLQEKTYRPLGATELRKANVRIIAATNRDLRQLMADGRFREDLYYRLHTMPIEVPALRDRRRDVRDLLTHFLARFSAQAPVGLGLGAFRASPSAIHAAESYDWPGNVRELEHRTRTGMLLCHGEGASIMERRHLFPETVTEDQAGDEALTFHEATRRFQRRLLIDVLRRTQWNKTEAAQALDISRSSIHNYIRAFGIDETGPTPGL
jgi:Nif-specific regulatory protein